MRRLNFSNSMLPAMLMLMADTATGGGGGGGTAVVSAPATSGTAPTGDNVTATGDGAPKVRKPRVPNPAVKYDTLEAATAAPKPSAKHTVFKATMPGKPDRFYVASHRSAVVHAMLTEDGVKVGSAVGGRTGRTADPAKKLERAEKALNSMDEATRKALFEKYMSKGATTLPPTTGAASAASAPASGAGASAARSSAPAGVGAGKGATSGSKR